MAYLTKKDESIFKYLNKYKGITIQQASLMFFPHNQHSYTYARLKLKKMYDKKQLKFYKNDITNEYIYYIDGNPKGLLTHDILCMTLYANFIYYNINILYYNNHELLLNGEIKPDGFIIYQFNNKTKAAFIECDIFHETDNKYEKLFETGIMQDKFGDFPNVIILNKTSQNKYSDNFTIINMDLKCSNFVEKVFSF